MNESLHCHCGRITEFRVREEPPVYTVDFYDPHSNSIKPFYFYAVEYRTDGREPAIERLPITHCPACGTDLYAVLCAGAKEENANNA